MSFNIGMVKKRGMLLNVFVSENGNISYRPLKSSKHRPLGLPRTREYRVEVMGHEFTITV